MRTWSRQFRPRPRGEHGAAAVEFALILLPFLILLFGMIQYSMYFWSAQSGASAARESVRRAAVGDQDCGAFSAAAASNVRLADGPVTAKRTYFTSTGITTPAPAVVGGNVKVTVSYVSVNMHFPFVPFPNGGAIQESSYARVENTTSNSVEC